MNITFKSDTRWILGIKSLTQLYYSWFSLPFLTFSVSFPYFLIISDEFVDMGCDGDIPLEVCQPAGHPHALHTCVRTVHHTPSTSIAPYHPHHNSQQLLTSCSCGLNNNNKTLPIPQAMVGCARRSTSSVQSPQSSTPSSRRSASPPISASQSAATGTHQATTILHSGPCAR